MASSARQYGGHPLPPSPPAHDQQQHLQPQQPYVQPQTAVNQHPALVQQRQGKTRSFSFQSNKSHKSSNSKGNASDLHETHDEKEQKRLHSKADPTLAISEAEPSAVAAMMTQTATPLRSMQHKDSLGNPIADPDKSNPTRNRWERPLETIRSFEAAIDGGYNRKSMYRTETDTMMSRNRRSSYQPSAQPRFRPDSYYGNSRPVSYRADHHYPMPPHQEGQGYQDGPGGGPVGYSNGHGGYGHPPPRHRASRMYSEPHYSTYGRDSTVYPMPHKDRSYETVTSAAASGSSDHAGYHTDPTSSDNSSIDRQSPAKRPEPINDYGIGFSHQNPANHTNFSVGVPNQSHHPLPSPPQDQASQGGFNIARKQPSVLRRQPVPQPQPMAVPEKQDKRKSWFSRRFSKNG